MTYQSPDRANWDETERKRAEEKRKRVEAQRDAAIARQHLTSYPAGVVRGHWILWKPGLDPAALLSESRRQTKLRRASALLAGIVAIIAIVVGAIFLVGTAFSAGFWWGLLSVLGSLVFGGAGVLTVLDLLDRTASDEAKRFVSWIAQSHGTTCFAAGEQFSDAGDVTEGAAAKRIVDAVRSIHGSYSLESGWLDQDTALRAHEDAWNSLIRTTSVSPEGREQHLTEVAASLEAVAKEVRSLDAELRLREKSEELKQLRGEYLKVQDRATVLQDEVQARRKFLAENPE